jgi:hypothetical protein
MTAGLSLIFEFLLITFLRDKQRKRSHQLITIEWPLGYMILNLTLSILTQGHHQHTQPWFNYMHNQAKY